MAHFSLLFLSLLLLLGSAHSRPMPADPPEPSEISTSSFFIPPLFPAPTDARQSTFPFFQEPLLPPGYLLPFPKMPVFPTNPMTPPVPPLSLPPGLLNPGRPLHSVLGRNNQQTNVAHP